MSIEEKRNLGVEASKRFEALADAYNNGNKADYFKITNEFRRVVEPSSRKESFLKEIKFLENSFYKAPKYADISAFDILTGGNDFIVREAIVSKTGKPAFYLAKPPRTVGNEIISEQFRIKNQDENIRFLYYKESAKAIESGIVTRMSPQSMEELKNAFKNCNCVEVIQGNEIILKTTKGNIKYSFNGAIFHEGEGEVIPAYLKFIGVEKRIVKF